MKRLNALDWIALILLIIGGLNYGMVGIFGLDLVARTFRNDYIFARVVYSLVAAAAVYMIVVATTLRKK